MAHKGKAYRLAFRRDLSLQTQPNRVGWPHTLLPIVGNAFGSIGSLVSGFPFELVLSFDSTTGAVTGESQHLVVAGSHVYCRIDGTIGGFPKFYTCKMSWWKETNTKLFERTVMSSIPAQYFSFGADHADGVTFQTPGVFEANPSSPASDGFRAKPWH